MKEIGTIIRLFLNIFLKQGQSDCIMVFGIRIAIPKHIKVIDIFSMMNMLNLSDVLHELKKSFSVEKIILTKHNKDVDLTYFKKILKVWSKNLDTKVVLWRMSHLLRDHYNVWQNLKAQEFQTLGVAQNYLSYRKEKKNRAADYPALVDSLIRLHYSWFKEVNAGMPAKIKL